MITQDFGKQWHESQLGPVDDEIARLAFVCGVKMLNPGVIERVIAGDESICSRSNPKAFKKLRSLVGLHYALTNDSIAALGHEESAKILEKIRARLRKRFDIGGSS